MRILLVVHQFFPEFRSGTETLTRRTAEELKRRGHTVCILTATPHQPSRPVWTREQWEGLDIIRFSPNPVSSPLCGGVEQSYLRPEFESDFALLLKELKPDLMHVFHLRRHTLSLVRAAVRCSVPMVASLTDYWLACPTGQMQFPAAVACDGPRIDGANSLPVAKFILHWVILEWIGAGSAIVDDSSLAPVYSVGQLLWLLR